MRRFGLALGIASAGQANNGGEEKRQGAGGRRRQAEAGIAIGARSAAFRRDGALDELDGDDVADPAGTAARGQRHIAALKDRAVRRRRRRGRSEEHTSELQSLMRISYAVFCLKTKKKNKTKQKEHRTHTH